MRKKEANKEATRSDAISTYRRVYLRQKALRKTQNCGLGVGEDSGTVGKETKQRRQVGYSIGKDRRQAGGRKERRR